MILKQMISITVLFAVLKSTLFGKNRLATNVKNVINEFADSHVNTDASKLSRILSPDVVQKFSKGDEVLSQFNFQL
jgi:hypothetical protein